MTYLETRILLATLDRIRRLHDVARLAMPQHEGEVASLAPVLAVALEGMVKEATDLQRAAAMVAPKGART